jgi:hypothetical protein
MRGRAPPPPSLRPHGLPTAAQATARRGGGVGRAVVPGGAFRPSRSSERRGGLMTSNLLALDPKSL